MYTTGMTFEHAGTRTNLLGGPEREALMVGDDGGLHRVLLLLPRDERTAPAAAGQGPADLDLGGVQPELDAFGLGIANTPAGVRSRRPGRLGTAYPRSAGNPRISPIACVMVERSMPNKSPDAACGTSSRIVISVTTSRSTNGSRCRAPAPASRFVAPAAIRVTTPLDPGQPRTGQLRNQRGETPPGGPREHLMRENRPADHDRHIRIMPSTSNNTSSAITHQLVKVPRS